MLEVVATKKTSVKKSKVSYFEKRKIDRNLAFPCSECKHNETDERKKPCRGCFPDAKIRKVYKGKDTK